MKNQLFSLNTLSMCVALAIAMIFAGCTKEDLSPPADYHVIQLKSTPVADGFAAGTTGGAGGSTVTVTSASAFKSAAESSTTQNIVVSGTLDVGQVNVRSNKTISGANTSATIRGNLRLSGVSNVIIHNLNITNPSGAGTGDGIEIRNSTRVFVTKCTFTDCADGSLDIVAGADLVTVSWCRFRYPTRTSHQFVNLIGNGDDVTSDRGKLRVTMHDNWYDNGSRERMPRVRFGQVHVYNTYYGSNNSNYCIGVGNESQILVENSYFENQSRAWANYSSSGAQGRIQWRNLHMVNSPTPTWASNSSVFNPPYSYSVVSASTVKSRVTGSNGAGNTGTSSGGGGGTTYYQIQNRGTGLYLDGMGRTSDGSALGQYANTTHQNSHWIREVSGGYERFRNRGTGLYIDGMGRTTNGEDCGQWANTNHNNAQWSLESAGSGYYRLRNRGTGMYLDGMGRTSNGSAAGQWANTDHQNAHWRFVQVQ